MSEQYGDDQYNDQYVNDQYINEETYNIQQKLANISLESENDGVNVIEPPQTQEAQRKQQVVQ